MEKQKITRGLLNSTLLIRIDQDTKDKLLNVANYYGMPDISSLVRKLIDNTVKKYEENIGK